MAWNLWIINCLNNEQRSKRKNLWVKMLHLTKLYKFSRSIYNSHANMHGPQDTWVFFIHKCLAYASKIHAYHWAYACTVDANTEHMHAFCMCMLIVNVHFIHSHIDSHAFFLVFWIRNDQLRIRILDWNIKNFGSGSLNPKSRILDPDPTFEKQNDAEKISEFVEICHFWT